jgi:hypothetical protein
VPLPVVLLAPGLGLHAVPADFQDECRTSSGIHCRMCHEPAQCRLAKVAEIFEEAMYSVRRIKHMYSVSVRSIPCRYRKRCSTRYNKL